MNGSTRNFPRLSGILDNARHIDNGSKGHISEHMALEGEFSRYFPELDINDISITYPEPTQMLSGSGVNRSTGRMHRPDVQC